MKRSKKISVAVYAIACFTLVFAAVAALGVHGLALVGWVKVHTAFVVMSYLLYVVEASGLVVFILTLAYWVQDNRIARKQIKDGQ